MSAVARSSMRQRVRNHARRAGVHEPARQTNQTFAFDLFAERSLTRTQHYEIGIELEIVDVVQTQETILRPALFVNEREHNTGQIRMLVID